VEKSSLIYQLTGAPIHSAYALAQMRVFYNNLKGEHLKSLCAWKTIASICLSRWTGKTQLPITYSEASWTGLLNFDSCQYEKAALDLLPGICQNHLPKLVDFDEERFNLDKLGKYWFRWPKLRNTHFFLGVGDGACANVGSGCTLIHQIACTMGTSAAARICLELPIRGILDEIFIVDSGLFCYRINKTHVLIGGALTDGGSVVEWVRKLLRLSGDSDFRELLYDVRSLVTSDYAKENTQSAKSEINLTVVPFLSGERSTGFRSGATGKFERYVYVSF
jgi:gluconokinase